VVEEVVEIQQAALMLLLAEEGIALGHAIGRQRDQAPGGARGVRVVIRRQQADLGPVDLTGQDGREPCRGARGSAGAQVGDRDARTREAFGGRVRAAPDAAASLAVQDLSQQPLRIVEQSRLADVTVGPVLT
jgi:hypothetical protein